jgi:hypothetical protein
LQASPSDGSAEKVQLTAEGDRIRHMTKIWHCGLAMKELGWV